VVIHALIIDSVLFWALGTEPVPPPLLLSIGVGNQPQATLITPWPVLAAAALVAIIAIFGTVLLSRRVLQPIDTLTAASRQLGAGDRRAGEFVPPHGRIPAGEQRTAAQHGPPTSPTNCGHRWPTSVVTWKRSRTA
jgi:hypothetical protein